MGAPTWPPSPGTVYSGLQGGPAMGMLDGKVAVVTGGGTGIGRAVSIGLAAAGAKVVVNDYGVSVDGMDPSREPANQVVAEIRQAGGQALAAPDSVATTAGGRAAVGGRLG